MGLTRDDPRRFVRQIPLIGEAGQARLCAATCAVPAGDDPASAWQIRYLERAGVNLSQGDVVAAPALPAHVVGEDPALPELLGALAATRQLIALLAEPTTAR